MLKVKAVRCSLLPAGKRRSPDNHCETALVKGFGCPNSREVKRVYKEGCYGKKSKQEYFSYAYRSVLEVATHKTPQYIL